MRGRHNVSSVALQGFPISKSIARSTGITWEGALARWRKDFLEFEATAFTEVLYEARRKACWLRFAFFYPLLPPDARIEFPLLYGKMERGRGPRMT